MYTCPACGADGGADARCRCGADLTILQRLDGVADAWFNRALESISEGRTGRALEWLSACCAARPADSAARVAQAKVWAQLNRPAEALDALERAAAIDPEAPGIAELRKALRALKARPDRKRRKAAKA